ncbi:alpha-1A adrenergic receptor-like [Octopus bimaculoides]|uniref:G-protein coupled receptors family 1 profile domain-containing protein n=1 Tax=Octopus bimaculoides TaxID=37653 RepID=A0A0L8H5F5_OCTBM|nr:alpha-1A adrenergic receptor-like [Octopus bimaculoides]
MYANFSLQNRTEDKLIRHSETIVILRTILLVLITIAIIFSNIINIWILRKVRELQTLGKVLLINLSVADFINGLFVCLPAVLASAYDRWLLSTTYCTVSCILHGITCTVSIWCLAIVSLDRYIAINFPVRYRNAKKMYYSIGILIAVWFFSLITFLFPQIFDSKYYGYQESIVMCGMKWKSIIFCIATGLYIPILSAAVIFFSSYKVSKALLAIQQAKINRRGQVKCSRDLKAIRMLKISTICYIAAWGPYTLIAYLKAFYAFSDVPEEIEFTVAWLANSNSFMNVIIYSGNLDGFLRQLKKTFSCCMCSRCCKDNAVYPDVHEDSNLPSTITQTNIY